MVEQSAEEPGETRRVRRAVRALIEAEDELTAALRAANKSGISANRLAAFCEGVKSRPTVLALLRDDPVVDEEPMHG